MTTTTRTLQFIGRRLTASGKRAYFYLPTDSDDAMGFLKPLMPGIRVGTLLEVKLSDTMSVYTKGEDAPRIVGEAAEKLVMEWLAETRADDVIYEREAQRKRAAAAVADPLAEHLDAIREAYRALGRMSIGRRSAFIDYVTTYVQS